MPEIDKVGVAWGVLFGVLINGIFLAILSLLHLNFQDMTLASVATIITFVIVIIAFRNLLFPESKEEKKKSIGGTTANSRELDIEIAQHNAFLQVYIAAIFGFFAVGVALLIFAYQFGFEIPLVITRNQVAFIAVVIAGIAIVVSLYFMVKLHGVLKKFKELGKEKT